MVLLVHLSSQLCLLGKCRKPTKSSGRLMKPNTQSHLCHLPPQIHLLRNYNSEKIPILLNAFWSTSSPSSTDLKRNIKPQNDTHLIFDTYPSGNLIIIINSWSPFRGSLLKYGVSDHIWSSTSSLKSLSRIRHHQWSPIRGSLLKDCVSDDQLWSDHTRHCSILVCWVILHYFVILFANLFAIQRLTLIK